MIIVNMPIISIHHLFHSVNIYVLGIILCSWDTVLNKPIKILTGVEGKLYFFKWYGMLEADKCLQIEENKENGSKV